MSIQNDANDYALNSEGFLESESATDSYASNVDDSEKLVSEMSTTPARLVGNNTVGENIIALLTKRMQIYKRDKTGLICEVCLPWIVVLLGCLITLLVFNKPQSSFALVPSVYPNPQRIMLNQNNVVTSTDIVTP